MAHGSSAALISMVVPPGALPRGPGPIQNTPRYRTPPNKTSSRQRHSEMCVVMSSYSAGASSRSRFSPRRGCKQFAVQQLVAEVGVEALAVAVLPGLPGGVRRRSSYQRRSAPGMLLNGGIHRARRRRCQVAPIPVRSSKAHYGQAADGQGVGAARNRVAADGRASGAARVPRRSVWFSASLRRNQVVGPTGCRPLRGARRSRAAGAG